MSVGSDQRRIDDDRMPPTARMPGEGCFGSVIGCLIVFAMIGVVAVLRWGIEW